MTEEEQGGTAPGDETIVSIETPVSEETVMATPAMTEPATPETAPETVAAPVAFTDGRFLIWLSARSLSSPAVRRLSTEIQQLSATAHLEGEVKNISETVSVPLPKNGWEARFSFRARSSSRMFAIL